MRIVAGILLNVLAVGLALVIYFYMVGGGENCTNGRDDDGDGWVDLQDPDCQPPPPPMVDIVVAAQNLEPGALQARDLTLKSVPENQLPKGAYRDAKRLTGRFLCANVKEDEPVLQTHMGAGLACVTPKNMRAMAVKVDEVVGVAGFIKPGDRVDVLVTIKQSAAQAKIVLQSILVLAIGSEFESRSNDQKPLKATVATLQVSPEEAQKLALASSQGSLRLALRSRLDKPTPSGNPKVPPDPTTIVQLMGGESETKKTQEILLCTGSQCVGVPVNK